KVRGAPAVDSDVNLGVREVEGDLGVGEAWHLLRRKERAFGVLGNRLETRAQYVCRDGEAAGALAAAERVARRDRRPVTRIRRKPPAHLRDDVGLRVLALVERQR